MKLSPYDYYEPNVFFIRSNNIDKYAKQFFNICNCDAKYKCCGDFSCPCFMGFCTAMCLITSALAHMLIF